MASSALEEKINKIRQQNEEIRRRYEEVEEDKKNAAKLNALVQMVPSSDWPERKEPPEFSNPPKVKQKLAKEKHEYVLQSHIVEGKKVHTFAQGEGPPPDPKYNFLADSEREEPSVEYTKESSGSRTHNKIIRGNFRKKTGERESTLKNNKAHKGNYRDESQPGYDAWRAERNRIDEDRISRQRTAEGNWRREWDNDKVHIVDDAQKNSSRPILGSFIKKDHKDTDRRYHANNNEHASHTRGGNRPHRGSSKNFCSNYDNRSHNTYDQHRNNATTPAKTPLSPTSDERTVVATDKSLKVTVNQANVAKGPVMSVKVNSPSIAGTGRVGPRQRTRVTYSHSDAEVTTPEGEPFHRQKSFEDRSKGTYYNNQKSPNVKRSHSQKKKEGDPKYPYHQRKETKKEDNDASTHRHDNEFRSYGQKDSQKLHSNISPKLARGNVKAPKQDLPNINSSEKPEAQECSNLDLIKFENNVTENSEISKPVVPADQTEISNTESEEVNTENEIKNETMLEKEVETSSLPFLSGTENAESTTKEETDKNSFDNKNECKQESVNDAPENLQGGDKSSEASIPNDVESKEELPSNESNNVPIDTLKLEEAPLSTDDQQSLKQVSEQIANNNCDNIKDEMTGQRSTQETIDDHVSSLDVEPHSVIEVKNETICNTELTQEDVSVANEKTDESNECLDKDLKDIANTSEISQENDEDRNTTEENKEKSEELKDNKQEL